MLFMELKRRILKYKNRLSERVILSQNENDTWIDFDNILSGLARETQNPNTEKAIIKIQNLLNDLWEEMEVEIE